jgi:hypothetical protein
LTIKFVVSYQENAEMRNSNAHFGVGRDGTIVQFLPMYETTVQSYGAFGFQTR